MAYDSADPMEPEDAPAAVNYRALILNADNEVVRAERLMAVGYGTAVAIARAMAGEHSVELWQGSRCIERLHPPEATGV